MKKFVCFLVLIIVACAAFTPAKNSVTHSAITFQTRNMGIGVGGSIGGLQAELKFNATNLAASTIEASVDANTINTDNSSRDDHLKGEDFFDVAHYPRISLKSVSFKHKNGNNNTGQFNLTMKGKTKLVEIPFSYTEKGNTSAFKGSFKLNRLDFGVGDGSLILADEVTVNIDAEASN
jgi:polyisoprenoid-binding protein YceI